MIASQWLDGEFLWNPSRALMDSLGRWALRLFLAAMAMGPLHRLTGWAPILAARRRFGVATFLYALAHAFTYIGLEWRFEWSILLEDMIKRGAITVGAIALVLMVPLAATSRAAAISALGAPAWRRLHWLAYPAFAHAIYHYGLMAGRDKREAFVYTGIALGLVLVRVAEWLSKNRRRWPTSPTSSPVLP